MNKQLRRLGLGLLACYLALVVMVNYVQVFHAEALNTNPINSRAVVRDFDRARGQIVSADGAVLAQTVPSAPGDHFAYQRVYPEADLFGHITGYLNFNFGATGVEQQYNADLSGVASDQSLQTLRDVFTNGDTIGNVQLTVRKDLQQIARDALGEHKGSVVALDPRDGSILALWSFPSYDPNPLASHDAAASQAAKNALDGNPDLPLRGRTWQERFFPGSTFKLVTGSIGVDTGKVTESNPSYPVLNEYKPNDGKPIANFSNEVCGGTLFNILAVSCNSAFAQMGAETIGPDDMRAGAERFGFNSTPPIDLPAAVQSVFPNTGRSQALLGQASIGQFNTAATPLEMAMVAGAIGNGGVMMTPHVLQQVTNDKGAVLKTYKPSPWRTVMSGDAADVMKQAMEGVVAHGTGTAAQISGLEVGGKTGTAQLGTTPPSSHAWFVCYAGPPGQPPAIAVAVLVEGEPGVSETTGGTVAAPIAKQIVQAALATG